MFTSQASSLSAVFFFSLDMKNSCTTVELASMSSMHGRLAPNFVCGVDRESVRGLSLVQKGIGQKSIGGARIRACRTFHPFLHPLQNRSPRKGFLFAKLSPYELFYLDDPWIVW